MADSFHSMLLLLVNDCVSLEIFGVVGRERNASFFIPTTPNLVCEPLSDLFCYSLDILVNILSGGTVHIFVLDVIIYGECIGSLSLTFEQSCSLYQE